jgi:hypothetical protein
MHREPTDHQVALGNLFTDADKAEAERQRHLPRVRIDKDGNEEHYTTAELEHRALKKSIREDEDDYVPPSPEPIECYATEINHKGTTDVTIVDGSVRQVTTPGGARTILNLAAKVGWEVLRLSYSRGPYIGARGESLGVSDILILVVRAPIVDGIVNGGVASWRDDKSDWAWLVSDGKTTNVGVRELTTFMKESPRAPEAA